jgi:hypothetical protein
LIGILAGWFAKSFVGSQSEERRIRSLSRLELASSEALPFDMN